MKSYTFVFSSLCVDIFVDIFRLVELEAVRLAEAGRTSEALDALNDAILKWPDRPSLLNDRAQVKRTGIPELSN